MRADEKVVLKVRYDPALHVTQDSTLEIDRLADAIATRLGNDAEVMVVQGELLSQAEGESISTALLDGRTVVLADADATELSSRLVSIWAEFCDAPHATTSKADGHIPFGPIPRGQSPGRLVIVSPKNLAVSYKVGRLFLFADDVASLLDQSSNKGQRRRSRRIGRNGGHGGAFGDVG